MKCPRKYQYQYVEWLEKEFEASPDLILWHSVHAALEYLYKQINIFKTPSEEELITYFTTTWDTEYAEASKEKPLQIKGDQTLEDYVRRWKAYLTSYYTKHSPFSEIKIIGTEMQVNFTLDDAGQKKFRWFIDRLDKEGETFIINDYKTNKNLPPEEKEEYREQLTLYGLGVQQKYGKYFTGIKARLYYLHFDIIDEWEITDEVLWRVVDKYSSLVTTIDTKKAQYALGDKKAFEPCQNAYCRYCEYQSLCPLWAHLKFDDEVIWWDLGEKTIKWLVDEFVVLSKQETNAKKQKDAIKELLSDYVQKHWLLKLFGNTGKISISELENVSITDKDGIRKTLQDLGVLDEALEVDRFKLQKLVKEGNIDFEKIKEFAERNTSLVFRGTEIKEKEEK